MSILSMGISPGPQGTRVIAMAGPSETILKARLSRQPSHPRALPTLLEAIALWQGVQVHAALCGRAGWGVRLEPLSRCVRRLRRTPVHARVDPGRRPRPPPTSRHPRRR